MDSSATSSSGSFTSAAVIIISVLILFWVYRDSTRRDAYPPLWFAVLGFSGLFIHWLAVPLGALVYMVARPKGRLVPCPHCGTPRLESLITCPKCGGRLRKECHRCHEAIPIEAAQCPQCGARV